MKKTRWIPISEKEPEEYTYVLVTISNEVAFGWKITEKTWCAVDDGHITGYNLFNTDEIKAWMPLPKPYKENK